MVMAGPGKVLTGLVLSMDWRARIYNARDPWSLDRTLEKLARRIAQN